MLLSFQDLETDEHAYNTKVFWTWLSIYGGDFVLLMNLIPIRILTYMYANINIFLL